jgi:hypothetical protein
VQKELQYYKMASMASMALLKIGDNNWTWQNLYMAKGQNANYKITEP